MMFIEDRVAAVKAGWRRLIDIETEEHGFAMLNMLSLTYRPSDLCLGAGVLQELAWYTHDVPAVISILSSEIVAQSGAILAAVLPC